MISTDLEFELEARVASVMGTWLGGLGRRGGHHGVAAAGCKVNVGRVPFEVRWRGLDLRERGEAREKTPGSARFLRGTAVLGRKQRREMKAIRGR